MARDSSVITLSSDLDTHISPSHLDLSNVKNNFLLSIENFAIGSPTDSLQSEAAAYSSHVSLATARIHAIPVLHST